ncbi:hypothetical protein BV20DRAFT_811554 [Pilatotrama ljubarskyi]|nr:hypothetical protein BV20DRAFT_811554 [Pilatotrama ljubarskyi]
MCGTARRGRSLEACRYYIGHREKATATARVRRDLIISGVSNPLPRGPWVFLVRKPHSALKFVDAHLRRWPTRYHQKLSHRIVRGSLGEVPQHWRVSSADVWKDRRRRREDRTGIHIVNARKIGPPLPIRRRVLRQPLSSLNVAVSIPRALWADDQAQT